MSIKAFYTIGKKSQRIKFDLGTRLGMLPQTVWKEIYDTLTDESDKLGRHRKRFSLIIKDEVADLYGYEIAVMCDKIGCTVQELMNENIPLLPIYLKKMAKDEEIRALNEYGLVKD